MWVYCNFLEFKVWLKNAEFVSFQKSRGAWVRFLQRNHCSEVENLTQERICRADAFQTGAECHKTRELAWSSPVGLLHFGGNSPLLALSSWTVLLNLCLGMARADYLGILGHSCLLWIPNQLFLKFCHSWLWKTKGVVLCSSTNPPVQHLGQFWDFFRCTFIIFPAEFLSSLELIFSCIWSSFFSRCSWGGWDLQNDFLGGFWLLLELLLAECVP